MGIRFDLNLNDDIEPQITDFFNNLSELFSTFEKPITFEVADILSRIQDKINKVVQQELTTQVKHEFLTESDPNGNRWKQKKVDTGTPQMVVSGKLKNSFRIQKTAKKDNSWQITNNVDYAKYLQEGTSKMVARKMLPEVDLPDSWRESIYDAILYIVDSEVQRAFDLL